jgi:Transaldolase/Fructose-6-phosphate aldolase
MKATRKLRDAGQSLWLDNITRDLLTSGTLKRYIDELSITGLTSNPTIFDYAIKNSVSYDDATRKRLKAVKLDEGLFFEIALEDITQAADLIRPTHERTFGVDGWVSLEFSPVLARDAKTTLAEARQKEVTASCCMWPRLKAYRRGAGRRQRQAGEGSCPSAAAPATTPTRSSEAFGSGRRRGSNDDTLEAAADQ